MTTACIVGDDDVVLQDRLFSHETARQALAGYDRSRPFENTVAVETVSLGSAVAFLNDLDWYLVRYAKTALVREPSIHPDEWLSRDLASAVRADRVRPEETDRYYQLYGLDGGSLVEPLYVQRDPDTGFPEYDLRDVEDTVRVRVTREEFEG